MKPAELGAPSRLHARFASARPWPHLVLDSFLEPLFARSLLSERPPKDSMLRGGDYTGERLIQRDVRTLGPSFKALDAYLSSPEFLRWLEKVSGTKSLIRNPARGCGGLFLDGPGVELDPHLDVNCTVSGRRRRATLLYYLNSRWSPRWGGVLELHRSAKAPATRKIMPRFNRAVIIAGSDSSWHGYRKIALPRGGPDGRWVLIVNYYGLDERGKPHYNMWMPRPLPSGIKAGRRLNSGDLAAIRTLLRRRKVVHEGLSLLERRAAPGASRGVILPESPRLPAAGTECSKRFIGRLRAVFAAYDEEISRLYGREAEYRSRLA